VASDQYQSLSVASDAQLRDALERSLFNYYNAPLKIVQLERDISEYSSSFTIEELKVKLENGLVLSLMFKDLSSRALLDEARRTKPDFLFDPKREIEVYQSILSQSEVGCASYYGSVVNERDEQFWLFLEKVPGIELYQVGEFDVWLEVAKWLANFHKSYKGRIESLATEIPLLRYDRDFHQIWPDRVRSVLQARQAATASQIDILVRGYRRVIEQLLQLPPTLLHGDFYPSNVMVQSKKRGLRICAVDWEMAGAGPGIIDLAALVSGGWTERQEADLILTYMNTISPEPGSSSEREKFIEDVACGQLHLAMQWLGWSASWSPPEDHKQNWLQIALGIIERFGW